MNNLNGATVTLPLKEFDILREGEREYRRMAAQIASCFTYMSQKTPEPTECKQCTGEVECFDCGYYIPEYDEKLMLDFERIVKVTKRYALYGKEVETNIDAIPVSFESGGR